MQVMKSTSMQRRIRSGSIRRNSKKAHRRNRKEAGQHRKEVRRRRLLRMEMMNKAHRITEPIGYRRNGMETGERRKKRWQVINRSGKLLHGRLTEQIIGFCYEAHRQYGSGQKESVYQNALEEKFSAKKILFKREAPITVLSEDTGNRLGSHRLDFFIDEKVILKIKAIKFTPAKLEQQLYSYLRNSPYKVGLMINFGSSRLFVRRVILT